MEKLQKIIDAITSVKGITLLGKESDHDHNRSVITFVGSPDAIFEAAFNMTKTASEVIDLHEHQGVHPRLGATDVLPLIPLKGVSVEETRELAEKLGKKIGEELEIPIYMYEYAATDADKKNLAHVRKKGYKQKPDFGPDIPHPKAGATCLGVRKILVAFNVNVDSTSLQNAKKIARKIRESSGGIPFLKALGLRIDEKDCVQISMNLTDYTVTGIKKAFKAVEKEAKELELEIIESELIGFAPKAAFEGASMKALKLPEETTERILDDKLGFKI